MQRFTNRWLQRIGLIPRDGPWCHAFGMVGLVKELVDEMGAAAISRQNSRGVTTRTSRIATLMIKPGITFALKRE
jgi:hypothetical protein